MGLLAGAGELSDVLVDCSYSYNETNSLLSIKHELHNILCRKDKELLTTDSAMAPPA